MLGTRPEAIKLLPVYTEFARQGHTPKIYFTAQHEDMVDPILGIFGLSRGDCLTADPPKSRSLSGILTHFTTSIGSHLQSGDYDVVVVQGDTTTTLAGALAASYAQMPVVHVEAGLRSFNRKSPFPEEINRCVVTSVADLHFPPTTGAAQNLIREGVSEDRIHVVGNTGIDALHMVQRSLDDGTLKCSADIERLIQRVGDRDLVLVTGHRRENQEYNIGAICRELSLISKELADKCVFIYVTHPSPNVQRAVESHLDVHEACLKVPALGYVDFIKLMAEACVIVTDSGGIQEEAPSFGTYAIVTRDSTERSESIELGYSELVGDSMPNLRKSLYKELFFTDRALRSWRNPYGDGNAAVKIVNLTTELIRRSL